MKRIISGLVALIMILGLCPFVLAAAGNAAIETATVTFSPMGYLENNVAYRNAYMADIERKATVTTSAKTASGDVSYCYDGSTGTCWGGSQINTPETSNWEVTFTFESPESIGRILYEAHSSGAGFAASFEIWGSESDGEELKHIIDGEFEHNTNGVQGKVLISFKERTFKKLKFVWKTISGSSVYFYASEFGFWKAESKEDAATREKLEKDVRDLFLDDSCTSLAYGVDTDTVEALAEECEAYNVPGIFSPYLEAALAIMGEPGHDDIHEPITLSQRGERNKEFSRVRSTYVIGGQYDVSGYYARPGEVIGVYASYDEEGPAPSIVFATANRSWSDSWFGGWDGIKLENGYNTIDCTGMDGCQLIYFYNPALPGEQEFAPVVRLSGGTKYPVYRYNSQNPEASDDGTAFMDELKSYCEEVKKTVIDADVEAGKGKYNVCELVSDRIVLTTSALGALPGLEKKKEYKNEDGTARTYSGPKDLMELWDQVMVEDYAKYMGFNTDDPTHEDYMPRPAMLWRVYTEGYGLAWAQSIYAAWNASSFDVNVKNDEDMWNKDAYLLLTDPSVLLDANWATYHELGHVYDSGQIGFGESTNNLYALMASVKYTGKTRMESENRWYRHLLAALNDGIVPDDDMIFYPATIIFQLEFVDFDNTALYKDIDSLYGKACRYARLHRGQVDKISDKNDRLIYCLSMGAGVDLSDVFAIYGHPVSDEVKWMLKKLPKDERPLAYADIRTDMSGGFTEEQKTKEPTVTLSYITDKGSKIRLTMDQNTYTDDSGSDANLQCFEIKRKDTTNGSNGEPEFLGITRDDLSTSENELYIFDDHNIEPSHTYEYTVTPYDCSLKKGKETKVTSTDITIGDECYVPLTWLGLNGKSSSNAKIGVGKELKVRVDYAPLGSTYDFAYMSWNLETNNGVFEIKDDPDYPGDPSRKVIYAKKAGSDVLRVFAGGEQQGTRSAQGYGRDENGYLRTAPQVKAELKLSTEGTGTAYVRLEGLKMEKDRLYLQKGQESEILFEKIPAAASTQLTPEWSTSNDEVVTVDTDGKVKAVGAGEATVTVSLRDPGPTTEDGELLEEEREFTETCIVQVTDEAIPPTDIKIDSWAEREGETPILYSGEMNFRELTVSAIPENATFNEKDVKWEIAESKAEGDNLPEEFNSYVAMLNLFDKGDNVIGAFGMCDGTVTIKASLTVPGSETPLTNTLQVKVDKEANPVLPEGIRRLRLNQTSANIKKDETLSLTVSGEPESALNAGKITWESSDTNVATVTANETDSKSATVTGVNPGKAEISCLINGKKAACTVTVTGETPLTGLKFEDGKESEESAERTLNVGDTYPLLLAPVPANATNLENVKWTCSNGDGVIKLDDKRGLAEAVGEGTATVTGTITQNGNGTKTEKSFNCKFTVTKKSVPLTDVAISETAARLEVGEQITLSLSPRPFNANTEDVKNISWTSSNENAVSLTTNGDGSVTAKAVGEGVAQITGKMGEFSASCEIAVEKIPDVYGGFGLTTEIIKSEDRKNITAVKVLNVGGEPLPEKMTVLIAVYHQNVLTSSTMKDLTSNDFTKPESGPEEATVTLDTPVELTEGSTAKVFVFDSLANISPKARANKTAPVATPSPQ